MSGLNKLFAVLGLCLAFIAIPRLIPKQTVVIKPDRTWHVVPRDTKVAANAVAHQDKKPTSAEAVKPAAEASADAPPRAVQAFAGPSTEIATDRAAVQAAEGARSPAVDQSAGTAPAIAAPAVAKPASPDVVDSGKDERGAPADPWAPVVTPAKDEPAATPSEASDPYAGLFTKPVTADREDGIADSDPRIAPILAAHPDRDLILCLAGCGNGISVVEIRRRPQVMEMVSAEMVPTSASLQAGRSTGDVVCIAGCVGRPGEVVFKNVRLSWISDEGSTHVKQALRAIADRIVANEGLDIETFPRNWVSDVARAGLVEEPTPIEPFSFVGARVAGWMVRVPVAALED